MVFNCRSLAMRRIAKYVILLFFPATFLFNSYIDFHYIFIYLIFDISLLRSVMWYIIFDYSKNNTLLLIRDGRRPLLNNTLFHITFFTFVWKHIPIFFRRLTSEHTVLRICNKDTWCIIHNILREHFILCCSIYTRIIIYYSGCRSMRI